MTDTEARARRRAALERATQAFWAEIARAYPEIPHGDLPPDADHAFGCATERALDAWLNTNAPARQTNFNENRPESGREKARQEGVRR